MSDTKTKEPSRRDFIYVATAAAGAVTTAAAVWPLIDQMNPSADVQALSSIEVDVADVEPGSQITVKWLGKPVFIRRRTQDEIDEARSVDIASLPDPLSFNENKPDTDASDVNRTLDEDGPSARNREVGTRRYKDGRTEAIFSGSRMPEEDPRNQPVVAPKSVLRDALNTLQAGTSQYGYSAFPGSPDVEDRLIRGLQGSVDLDQDRFLAAEIAAADATFKESISVFE